MKLSTSLALLALCLFVVVKAQDDEDATVEQEDLTHVTCGSVIKLKHLQSGFRLHSHDIKYGSGSGQQSVTGFSNNDDANSLWVIKGPNEKRCKVGSKIRTGAQIRLQHLKTGRYLHSHLHRSPLSNQQEVSAYGEAGKGDTGDNWKVIPKGDFWKRGELVSFQHVDTAQWLASPNKKFPNPIPGQREIACVYSQSAESEWGSEEGFYFPS